MLLLALPEMRRLFISVKFIELAHTQCLKFVLHTPDTGCLTDWQAIHPEDTQMGCGPFRIVSFKDNLVRIESHESYHLATRY